MWTLETLVEQKNQIWKYQIQDDSGLLNFGQVIQLWQHAPEFNEWFVEQLIDSDCRAVRWETPPVILGNLDRPFEYVLVNSPALHRDANPAAFALQFRSANRGEVIAFANLGRNAMMVVPSPTDGSEDFCHLLEFLRNSSRQQATRLWQIVGREMENRIGGQPVWLSTAGGGVAWLHVRLDDCPKYYSYRPYREERLNP